jgi:hypothetical protein
MDRLRVAKKQEVVVNMLQLCDEPVVGTNSPGGSFPSFSYFVLPCLTLPCKVVRVEIVEVRAIKGAVALQ